MNHAPRSPRRFVRPLRLVMLLVVAGAFVVGFRSFSFVRLPAGPSPLFDFAPESRVVVREAAADRAPRRGDAVLYGTPEGRVAIGRVVAFAGDVVEVDHVRERVRGPDGVWYAAPERARAALPLQDGTILILAEDPMAAKAGAVVTPDRLVGRVVVALPF